MSIIQVTWRVCGVREGLTCCAAFDYSYHCLFKKATFPQCASVFGGRMVRFWWQRTQRHGRHPWPSVKNSMKLKGRSLWHRGIFLKSPVRMKESREEKSVNGSITCMPSCPDIPMPMSAAWIMLTSFAPSPEKREVTGCLYSLSNSSVMRNLRVSLFAQLNSFNVSLNRMSLLFGLKVVFFFFKLWMRNPSLF